MQPIFIFWLQVLLVCDNTNSLQQHRLPTVLTSHKVGMYPLWGSVHYTHPDCWQVISWRTFLRVWFLWPLSNVCTSNEELLQSYSEIKMSRIWWIEVNCFEVPGLPRLNANAEVNFRNEKDHRDHIIKCSHLPEKMLKVRASEHLA